MKNSILEPLFRLSFVLLLVLSSCDKNESPGTLVVGPERNDDSENYLKQTVTKIIQDKSGENELTIKISSNDEDILNDYLHSDLELEVIRFDDELVEEAFGSIATTTSAKNLSGIKLRVEIIKTKLNKSIVGFYLKENNNSTLLNFRKVSGIIQTEFISPSVCSGGFVQMALPSLKLRKSVQLFVEALDESNVDTRIRSIEPSYRSRLLTIGFSDKNGIAHPWRLKLIHDASIFPMVYWMGELSI